MEKCYFHFMKVHYFLFFVSAGLAVDGIVATVWPGLVWIAPFVLIALMVMDRYLSEHIPLVIGCACAIDFRSGVAFGYVTLFLALVAALVVLLKTRLRVGIIPIGSLFFLMLLTIPLSVPIIVHHGAVTVITTICISILCSIIHTTSSVPTKIH